MEVIVHLNIEALKAGPIANAPGLHLDPVSHRWMRDPGAQPAPPSSPNPYAAVEEHHVVMGRKAQNPEEKKSHFEIARHAQLAAAAHGNGDAMETAMHHRGYRQALARHESWHGPLGQGTPEVTVPPASRPHNPYAAVEEHHVLAGRKAPTQAERTSHYRMANLAQAAAAAHANGDTAAADMHHRGYKRALATHESIHGPIEGLKARKTHDPNQLGFDFGAPAPAAAPAAAPHTGESPAARGLHLETVQVGGAHPHQGHRWMSTDSAADGITAPEANRRGTHHFNLARAAGMHGGIGDEDTNREIVDLHDAAAQAWRKAGHRLRSSAGPEDHAAAPAAIATALEVSQEVNLRHSLAHRVLAEEHRARGGEERAAAAKKHDEAAEAVERADGDANVDVINANMAHERATAQGPKLDPKLAASAKVGDKVTLTTGGTAVTYTRTHSGWNEFGDAKDKRHANIDASHMAKLMGQHAGTHAPAGAPAAPATPTAEDRRQATADYHGAIDDVRYHEEQEAGHHNAGDAKGAAAHSRAAAAGKHLVAAHEAHIAALAKGESKQGAIDTAKARFDDAAKKTTNLRYAERQPRATPGAATSQAAAPAQEATTSVHASLAAYHTARAADLQQAAAQAKAKGGSGKGFAQQAGVHSDAAAEHRMAASLPGTSAAATLAWRATHGVMQAERATTGMPPRVKDEHMAEFYKYPGWAPVAPFSPDGDEPRITMRHDNGTEIHGEAAQLDRKAFRRNGEGKITLKRPGLPDDVVHREGEMDSRGLRQAVHSALSKATVDAPPQAAPPTAEAATPALTEEQAFDLSHFGKYRAHTEIHPSGLEIRVHHKPANTAGFSWSVHDPAPEGSRRAPVVSTSGAPAHSLEAALKKARRSANDTHAYRTKQRTAPEEMAHIAKLDDKISALQAATERLGGQTQRERDAAQHFPLGTGSMRPTGERGGSTKRAEQRMDASIDRAGAFVDTTRELQHAQAERAAYAAGQINESGRSVNRAPKEAQPRRTITTDQKSRGVSKERAALEAAAWRKTHTDYRGWHGDAPTIVHRGGLHKLGDLSDDDLRAIAPPTSGT